jgi:hypothetical protein
MKMAVFWYAVPCSMVILADISEELTASIIRVINKLHIERM